MKKCLQVLTVTLLGGSILGCGSDSSSGPALNAAAVDDTARLDQAYVPALFYSSMSSAFTTDASDTLDGTSAVWTDYKTTYADYLNWDTYFGDVDANLTVASDHYASTPADLVIAHDALESVRDSWSDMRNGSGIKNYFFDKLTAAHHTMEPVAGAYVAFTKTAQQEIDLIALQTALGATLPAFRTDWNALVSNFGNGNKVTDSYNFGADKSAALKANISGMKDMLDSLSAVVETCNSADYVEPPVEKGASVQVAAAAIPLDDCGLMISYSSMVKSKFVPVFLAFGDFINPFMADIIASNRAIIPAMYCTGNPPDAAPTCGGRTGTLAFLGAYAVAMQTFGAHFPSSLVGGLGWAPSMMTAQAKLLEAIDIVAAAADLAEAKANGAHAAIEAISSAMYYICASYENQVTIMTRMNEYHTAFEAVIAMAANEDGSKKGALTAQEVADINALMAALQTAFANMSAQAAIMDYPAWSLTAGDLDADLSAQETNIGYLLNALATFDADTNDNSAVIVDTAFALKSNYIPFFKKLGNFALPG